MADPSPKFVSFAGELKRRKVFRVAAAYAAAVFIVLQVVSLVVEPLGLPSWTMTLVIVLTALGFPIALILAWAYDVTPADERAASEDTPGAATPAAHADGVSGAPRHEPFFKWRRALWGTVGALALWGLIAIGWLLVDPMQSNPPEGPADSTPRRPAESSVAAVGEEAGEETEQVDDDPAASVTGAAAERDLDTGAVSDIPANAGDDPTRPQTETPPVQAPDPPAADPSAARDPPPVPEPRNELALWRTWVDSAIVEVGLLRGRADPSTSSFTEGERWRQEAMSAAAAGDHQQALILLTRAAEAFGRPTVEGETGEAIAGGALEGRPETPERTEQTEPPERTEQREEAEPPERAGPSEDEARAIVSDVLSRLETALEAEDLDALRRVWLTLDAEQATSFEVFFDGSRDLDVTFAVDWETLDTETAQRVEFVSRTTWEYYSEPEQRVVRGPPFEQEFEIEQRGESWVIMRY